MKMSQSNSTASSPSPNPGDDLPSDIHELLAQLQHSHNMYYKMMNLEVWALVETLEQFFPGAWGRFMTHRQSAMKEFLQRKQAKGNAASDSPVGTSGENPAPPVDDSGSESPPAPGA